MQSISKNQPNQHQFGKDSNQFDLVRSRVIYGSQEIISTIQKTSKTSLAGPASRGSGGFSFTSTCLIWSLKHLNSNSSFFLQSMHDINSLQTINKIPRKLTYPLKPSRYKENTIYIHLAKILIIKPLTASFHGAINSFASKTFISIYFVSLSHFLTVRKSQGRAYISSISLSL